MIPEVWQKNDIEDQFWADEENRLIVSQKDSYSLTMYSNCRKMVQSSVNRIVQMEKPELWPIRVQ